MSDRAKVDTSNLHHIDDSVWLVRILYVDIYLSKFMKICRMAVIAYTLVMTTLQTFLFLQKFDGIYFIKYLALYAGSVVVSMRKKNF